MPYQTLTELPETVRETLPHQAQEVYRQAYNSAWDRYKLRRNRRNDVSREEVAHRTALNIVKQNYASLGEI